VYLYVLLQSKGGRGCVNVGRGRERRGFMCRPRRAGAREAAARGRRRSPRGSRRSPLRVLSTPPPPPPPPLSHKHRSRRARPPQDRPRGSMTRDEGVLFGGAWADAAPRHGGARSGREHDGGRRLPRPAGAARLRCFTPARLLHAPRNPRLSRPPGPTARLVSLPLGPRAPTHFFAQRAWRSRVTSTSQPPPSPLLVPSSPSLQTSPRITQATMPPHKPQQRRCSISIAWC
jgi:hypothetical protein